MSGPMTSSRIAPTTGVRSGRHTSRTSSPASAWPSERSAGPEQPQAAAVAARQDLVEEVTESPQPEHLAPPSPAVLLPIVEHVTPLAERGEVAGPVVAGVVVQMRTGQNHARDRKTWGRGMPARLGCPSSSAEGEGIPRTPLPRPSRQAPRSASHQTPSPKCVTSCPCGRPQCSQQPLARVKRTRCDSSRQSMG